MALTSVDVSVVVVSYNALEWLRPCLAAIGPGADRNQVEVIVVDNASGNEVREFLATAPHGVRVIQLDENLGFGRACNLAVKNSQGRHVMLLNPDAVLEPQAIDRLVEHYDGDPGRGLVGGRTLRPDGTPDHGSCWGAPSVWSWFCSAVGLSVLFRRSRWFDPESLGPWTRETEREVDIITGCLLLTSRSVWDRLGGFDPDYFMYGEDADLCRRAWDTGYRPSITPSAVAVHAGGASSPHRLGKRRLLLRGKATFARKHWSPSHRRAGLILLSCGVGLRAVRETAAEVFGGAPDQMMRTLWKERATWLAGWPPA
ncbi:hypothetical protein GCM10022223_06100 [Kineosporia mesophila]|uniref:Glycosyltransferase 2-like domain-containing protein n=1 Tax=Kineosporia mesophila TaxID=566012 RepID=A0ABP6Z0Z9_9ACTN|nr:glycosyltransferase family 2 protein [Kineosporia mesophila]MCD5350994.1 glycosyltransferase family 2 protein [Kineosporia mesophila]